ncbi:hypothetical protein BGZ63DRAFT_389634 [Mariannaea sp. PMI_226]|nr:hypothetical protein BGZ63DRAFT_389634 [Mariannaea sp. PMI_226]
MENCWFVLKQSQFPPPRLPVNGIGIANGAICPGQIVATVDDLEGVINRSVEGFEFTPAVPIHPTKAWDLKWETGKSNQAGLSLDGDIPIAQLVGLSAHAKAALAFQHTVQRYRCFDRLDRYIILPTRSYIADVLDDPQVQDHIHNRSKNRKTLGDFLGAWKIYMVTGVTIARGSRGGSSESQNISANTGLGA